MPKQGSLYESGIRRDIPLTAHSLWSPPQQCLAQSGHYTTSGYSACILMDLTGGLVTLCW